MPDRDAVIQGQRLYQVLYRLKSGKKLKAGRVYFPDEWEEYYLNRKEIQEFFAREGETCPEAFTSEREPVEQQEDTQALKDRIAELEKKNNELSKSNKPLHHKRENAYIKLIAALLDQLDEAEWRYDMKKSEKGFDVADRIIDKYSFVDDNDNVTKPAARDFLARVLVEAADMPLFYKPPKKPNR